MANSVTAETWAIGVDVGGTKVAAGFVDSHGEILQHTRAPMNSRGTAEEGLAAVTGAIDELLKLAGETSNASRGIGICAPGPLDPHTGVVLNPPNVTCWRNYPLAREIANRYGGSVKLENDAKAAGLAEALWGAGRGYRNVFYTSIGTGLAREFFLTDASTTDERAPRTRLAIWSSTTRVLPADAERKAASKHSRLAPLSLERHERASRKHPAANPRCSNWRAERSTP